MLVLRERQQSESMMQVGCLTNQASNGISKAPNACKSRKDEGPALGNTFCQDGQVDSNCMGVSRGHLLARPRRDKSMALGFLGFGQYIRFPPAK